MSLSTHQRIRRRLAEEKAKAEAVKTEAEKAETTVTADDIAKMKSANLKNYAKENGIDFAGLKNADEYRAKILEHMAAAEDDVPNDSSSDDENANENTGGDENGNPAGDGNVTPEGGGNDAPEGNNGNESNSG
ncbi:MAG: hypothetical protein FWC16_00755 [Defluviitaleaceae bacterium]|nr:hypothetical protein [Defluviitaleaceae bacterium]MCL2273434.1 hypothetical protein [Defluviitaleaceae bacterium]